MCNFTNEGKVNYYTRTKRSNAYWQYFLIVVLCVCCIVKIWKTKQDVHGLWIDTALSLLYAKDFTYKLITTIFLLVNAVSITIFLRRFSLIEIRNYYPTLLYLLFIFIFPHNLTLWGTISGVFIIWGILPPLFDLSEDNIKSRTFSYGLCCGILSLIYTPFLLLLPLIYIVTLNERLYYIRAFILPIIGFLLAYVYLFVGFYLFDRIDTMQGFLEMARIQSDNISFGISLEKDPMSIFFLSISVLLGFISFIRMLQKSSSVVINKRKKQYKLLYILFFQSVLTVFFPAPYSLFSQIMIILYVILLSLSMLYMNKQIVYKIIFFVLFIIAFYNNFFINI